MRAVHRAIAAAIDRTCELARYLESRILDWPELELMAAVELNIVCFRYRGPEELADQLNREIVRKLQESGAVAPSTTTLLRPDKRQPLPCICALHSTRASS